MSANYREWHFVVIDKRTGKPYSGDFTYNVLADGSAAELTIYADDRGSSLANPTTTSGGYFKFYTAMSTSGCDITLLTDAGDAVWAQSLDDGEHRIEIDPNQMEQMLVLWYGSSSAEVDTGFDLPANSTVTDCLVYVKVADTGETLSVGILSTESAGDADGFIITATVASVGVVDMIALDSASGNFVSAIRYGTFLAHGTVGTSALLTGAAIRTNHRIVSGSQSISITGSTGMDTANGYVAVKYIKPY